RHPPPPACGAAPPPAPVPLAAPPPGLSNRTQRGPPPRSPAPSLSPRAPFVSRETRARSALPARSYVAYALHPWGGGGAPRASGDGGRRGPPSRAAPAQARRETTPSPHVAAG